jgi:hypothetical protein
MERVNINIHEISRARTGEMTDAVISELEARRLLSEAGIDARSWLHRRVSAGMVNLGELLVRLGEDLVAAYDSPSGDEGSMQPAA